MIRVYTQLICLLIAALAITTQAATLKGGSDASMASKQDEVTRTLEACEAMVTSEPMSRYAHLGESWSLLDLINPSVEENLAARYPTIIMNNDQLDWYVVNNLPRTKVKDPAYRVNSYWYYPMISAGVPQAGGRQIIGNYDTIQRAMKYIESRAKGKRASKMLGFVGPAGTGKTELGNLMVTARGILAMTQEEYFQFTYVFQDLGDIEGLEPMLFGSGGGATSSALKDVSMGRSPFVLLPEAVQKKVVELATPAFREAMAKKGIPMAPLPFALQGGKSREIVDAIIAHYQRKEKKSVITDRDYLRWLSPHVRVVRRGYETLQPPEIIRYLGKYPDMSALYFTENLALSQYYGPKDPRSYSYGLVPSNDGKPLFIDEFFRQATELRDSTLDLAQNGVAQNGGAPAEKLNVTIYFATNDDSVNQAKEDGAAKAHLSRTIRLPMRHTIEPWQVVKIAINDIGAKSFTMQKIEPTPDVLSEEAPTENVEPASPTILPYNAQEVIPDLASGEVVGSDGRYALSYRPDSADKSILIAPRSLWMMGLIAVGTRLVTDEKAFAKANEKTVEFSTYAKFRQYFVDPKERLHVLNGSKQVDRVVADELQKVRELMKEGQSGIGARGIENWFSEALAIAESSGGTVTPVVISKAFAKMLNSEGFAEEELTNAKRSQWILLERLVKAEFILPALTADVLAILQGHGRAERLYDDIKMEILALKKDRDAEYIEGEGNQRVPIDRDRLNEIYSVFNQISGYQFDPGMLLDFHVQVGRDSSTQRLPALLEAVRRYISKREIDKSTVSELTEYFNGKPVQENIRALGAQAEAQLERYGYDRSSFVQALLFVREQQHLLNKQIQR